MTYAQTLEQSMLVAHWLQAQFQVRKGDRVGIAMRNNLEHVVSWWACHLIGAVAVELNAFADSDTMTFCIADVGCRVVICDVERCDRIKPMLEDGKRLRQHETGANTESDTLRGVAVIPFGKGKGAGRVPKSQRSYLQGERHPMLFDYEELGEKWKASCPKEPSRNLKVYPEDNCHILFTSGTTGRPKGVLATHRQSLHNLGATLWIGARIFARRKRPLPNPAANPDVIKILTAYPLFHAAGLLSQLVTNSASGGKLVFMYQWDVDEAVKLMQQHKCNRFGGVAYMSRQLAQHPTELPSLSSISHGGSAAARELAAESYVKTGNGIIGNGYGATETSSFATGCYQDDYIAFPDGAGSAPPTTDIKIMDPVTLVEVPLRSKGEVWIRNSGIAEGYWNRPEATAEAFMADGFYRTGDLGYMNEHDILFIVDRVKDLIIRAGENISCTVVENGVYACSKIIEAAAVALPDSSLGERVAVFCVPRKGGEDVTVEEIKQAAKAAVVKHEVPEFVVITNEPLPKIPAGKVDKKILRNMIVDIAKQKGWGDYAKGAQTSKAKL